MTAIGTLPEAIHFGESDLPFVDFGGGNQFKVIWST